MRYEKPLLLDLGVTARSSGQDSRSCYAGPTPGPDWFLCETGGDPFTPAQSCGVGPAPGSGSEIMCISGSAVLSVCESGSGGLNDNTCTVGPSALFH
jgi:hypothetical protein